MLVGIGATQSRGGVLALAAGVVVLLVLTRERSAAFTRLAATGAGAAVAVTALLPLSPIDTAPNPALAAVALVGGALLTRALSIFPLRALVVMAAVGIVLTAAAVSTVPAAAPPGRRLTRRTASTRRWPPIAPGSATRSSVRARASSSRISPATAAAPWWPALVRRRPRPRAWADGRSYNVSGFIAGGNIPVY